jgi:LA2681-like HEPN
MTEFTTYLHRLLDQGDYETARKFVLETLDQETKTDTATTIRKIELYGCLIDIGCETSNEGDIEKGIDFLTNKEEEIKKLITISSYYYNLANAKHGLCKIFYSKNRGVHSISLCREKFQEPIDLYWVAYKNSDKNDLSFNHQILINLSNSLMTNCRIVEALQMLDTVLRDNPYFPQALISRGDNLHYLSLVTNCSVSIALFAQIYSSYKKGIETITLPPNILNTSHFGMEEAKQKIISYGFSMGELETEVEESQKEYEQHSDYRKFCIDNFLTLNEHSLYCNCIATSRDELQIGIPNAVFNGKLLPKLELLLNRIKSEYAFARWNYYKSFTDEAFDYDVTFSELFEDEVINSQSEALRASFRICYGILDKIALGICKLYGTGGGNIYFERFWEDKNRKEVLEKQKNIHLNALSSIANDLNSKRGELKHFKKWRNKIEHNLLILQEKTKLNIDVFNILDDKDFVAAVDINEFKEKTIHLLQLTRAAILSFVYCIRLETITTKEAETTDTFTISLKEQGSR